MIIFLPAVGGSVGEFNTTLFFIPWDLCRPLFFYRCAKACKVAMGGGLLTKAACKINA